MLASFWQGCLKANDCRHEQFCPHDPLCSHAGHTAFIRKHEANFEPLFAALEQYRQARGTYPEKLLDLTPDYVVTLPQCRMQLRSSGTFYSRNEDSYHLECMIGVSGLFPYRGWYNPNQAEWFYYD